jgi:hypothetical protein
MFEAKWTDLILDETFDAIVRAQPELGTSAPTVRSTWRRVRANASFSDHRSAAISR